MESLRTSSLPHCRHRNEGAETGVVAPFGTAIATSGNGRPQLMHAGAASDICFSQSGHVTRGIESRRAPYGGD
jgi:hypothetical protein